MSNNFYNDSGAPPQGGQLTSAVVRAEFAAIEAGFDKLPVLTGNSTKLVRVNAGETGLETAIANTDYATPSLAIAMSIALG